ncbi:flagellar motor protein MotB [Roseomonas sp. BN140053]|uniref:flagellar motor protein MotB n=1 Tax=Roseomonas sp. BN140053 TaxID=3391898 RepID=UPI0039E8BEC0
MRPGSGAQEALAKGRKGEGVTIVLRREEAGEAGHHGGAWKVAYADFVTAMMAFFLLMWLLNATTEEQRHGLADYFTPNNELAKGASGTGQPFGGRTPHEAAGMASNTGAVRLETGPQPVLQDIELDDDSLQPARPVLTREAPPGQNDAPDARPALVQTAMLDGRFSVPDPRSALAWSLRSSLAPAAADGSGGTEARAAALDASGNPAPAARDASGSPAPAARDADLAAASEAALRQELSRREQEALDGLAEQLRSAVRDDPALAELAPQLRVESVPEGLRIQLLDADRQPMFALGGTALNERSRALLGRVASVIRRVPNAVAITGHTDATPFRGGERSNWDLSAERANITRRLLVEGGVTEARLRSVAGLAEREPLLADNPNAAANRRVAILLLRTVPAAGTASR